MSEAEVFADHLRGHSFVHHVTVVGEVVAAVKQRNRNDDVSTFSKVSGVGWTIIMHVPDEGGDMYLFAPLEWFE